MMRVLVPAGGVTVLVLAAGLLGCATATESTSGPLIEFAGPARAMDDIECESLVTERELEGVLGEPVALVPLRRVASSCYWRAGDDVVQLALQVGPIVEGWRSRILKTYTRSVDTGADPWIDPEGTSAAAFGPERGLIVHGVGVPAQAIAILRLALPRL